MAKTALILGGTRGLGLSLAWESFHEGVRPFVVGRSSVGYWNSRFPPTLKSFKLDLSNPESVEAFGRMDPEPIDYFFWVAGNFFREQLSRSDPDKMEAMIATHLSGPIRALQLIHQGLHLTLKHPYHLVTIASTSSWRIRDNETLYCALKAAKAAFTRNFAKELARDLPGSKTTLVNPGGMKTENFWRGTEQDISNFMEPDAVAKIIWDEVQGQDVPFKEVQIMRNDDGSPNVSYGPRMPELPFGAGV